MQVSKFCSSEMAAHLNFNQYLFSCYDTNIVQTLDSMSIQVVTSVKVTICQLLLKC